MNQDAASKPGLLVFTDLDGTLMEHETYSVEAARPALASLARRQVPVILVSSKTAAEIQDIQRSLALAGPFVCENGAALHGFPGAENQASIEFGAPAAGWLPAVQVLRDEHSWQFEGFSDWSAEQVAALTGLDPAQALLAKQREYSEPILWRGSRAALEEFRAALADMDLQLLEGGRFLSLQGLFDKSDAMSYLKQAYASEGPVTCVALGDSPNDRAMLDAADIAVIIKSAKSDRIELRSPSRVIRSRIPGPAGWQEAMDEILSSVDDRPGKQEPA